MAGLAGGTATEDTGEHKRRLMCSFVSGSCRVCVELMSLCVVICSACFAHVLF